MRRRHDATRVRGVHAAHRAPRLVCCAALSLAGCIRGSTDSSAEETRLLRQYVLDQAPRVAHRLDVDFNGKVRLLGYWIQPQQEVSPGQEVKLTLYWQALKDLEPEWSLFTHVLDGTGERILNIDNVGPLRRVRDKGQILGPGAWTPGKFYVDHQSFTVPKHPRLGRIKIVAGIWRGGERLQPLNGPRDAERRVVIASLPTGGPRSRMARSTRVPELHVPRLAPDSKIVIDGRLDDAAWSRAASTGGFVNVSTGQSPHGQAFGGRAKLAWDDRGIYLGVQVTDPNVTGGFDPKQDDPHLWTRDTVELMVDPDGDGDNKDYYEIQINPQNLVFDSQFDDYNQPRDESKGVFGHAEWSAKLTSRVVVEGTLDEPTDHDQGYTVEALIPWKSFSKAARVPPRAGDEWRMNIYAMENNGGVGWSPILGQGNFHRASRFGRVVWSDRDGAQGKGRASAPATKAVKK
ncbi:MAG: carbohydrate-binding family 9-like protein [Polyangiaceae bacterium]|nr:carbohydrate-binding family 9-like protein [Polyangiaceae bacterium]